MRVTAALARIVMSLVMIAEALAVSAFMKIGHDDEARPVFEAAKQFRAGLSKGWNE